jgi:hypothetical protein
MVGPTIQNEMYDTLLRFRLHRNAFTAHIGKMYRQVRVNPSNSNFLRIVWSKDFNLPPEEYPLLTVTYEMASAPFTATRILQQLANEEGESFSFAKDVLVRDF